MTAFLAGLTHDFVLCVVAILLYQWVMDKRSKGNG